MVLVVSRTSDAHPLGAPSKYDFPLAPLCKQTVTSKFYVPPWGSQFVSSKLKQLITTKLCIGPTCPFKINLHVETAN